MPVKTQDESWLLTARGRDDGDVLGAVLHRVEILEARFDGIQCQVLDLLAALEKPLDYGDLIARIRQLKDGLRGE